MILVKKNILYFLFNGFIKNKNKLIVNNNKVFWIILTLNKSNKVLKEILMIE